MYPKNITSNKYKTVYNGVHIIHLHNPEIFFKFERFEFKIKIKEVKKAADSTRITASPEDNIYTFLVERAEKSIEFGYLKDPMEFFTYEDSLVYSTSFYIRKMMDHSYILTINIYEKEK